MNLVILLFSQFVAVTGSVLMVTLAGVIGAALSPSPALATLPVTLMVLGTAAGTIPAAWLMRRVGRAKGFALAKLLAALASVLAAAGLAEQSFALWNLATALFGLNLAFVQQYRFAAAESASPGRVSQAISLVLLGSIGGAILGPRLSIWGYDWLAWGPYTGALLTVAGLCCVSGLLLLRLRMPQEAGDVGEAHRIFQFTGLLRRPLYWVAVLGGLTAYAVMTLVMTATPLSMHIHEGHTMVDVAWVIQSHVLAMYAPSLLSGWLIDRFGPRKLMVTGCAILVLALVAALQGQAVVHYWWSLVLLGMGWNLLYVGSTTLLTQSYQEPERFQAQALNDFSVFGSSAAASLLAGALLHYLGWTSLVLVALPLVVLFTLILMFVRRPIRATSL